MADEIIIKRKTESESASTGSAPQDQNVNLGRTELVSLCAAGMGVSFFLPWANFFGANLSGFDLQKMGAEQRLLWLIPIACALTILLGVKKISQKVVGHITSALPFGVGLYWYNKLGSDLTHILAYGAYLSLILGGVMSYLLKKAK
jgi:hypothetical protein